MTVVGCDGDGKVVSIDPSSFNEVGDSGTIIMGYIDTPMHLFNNPDKLLEYWAGRVSFLYL